MLALLLIITAGVYLGIMFARNSDPVKFQNTQLRVRRCIGNTIVYITLGLLAWHLLGKVFPAIAL